MKVLAVVILLSCVAGVAARGAKCQERSDDFKAWKAYKRCRGVESELNKVPIDLDVTPAEAWQSTDFFKASKKFTSDDVKAACKKKAQRLCDEGKSPAICMLLDGPSTGAAGPSTGAETPGGADAADAYTATTGQTCEDKDPVEGYTAGPGSGDACRAECDKMGEAACKGYVVYTKEGGGRFCWTCRAAQLRASVTGNAAQTFIRTSSLADGAGAGAASDSGAASEPAAAAAESAAGSCKAKIDKKQPNKYCPLCELEGSVCKGTPTQADGVEDGVKLNGQFDMSWCEYACEPAEAVDETGEGGEEGGDYDDSEGDDSMSESSSPPTGSAADEPEPESAVDAGGPCGGAEGCLHEMEDAVADLRKELEQSKNVQAKNAEEAAETLETALQAQTAAGQQAITAQQAQEFVNARKQELRTKFDKELVEETRTLATEQDEMVGSEARMKESKRQLEDQKKELSELKTQEAQLQADVAGKSAEKKTIEAQKANLLNMQEQLAAFWQESAIGVTISNQVLVDAEKYEQTLDLYENTMKQIKSLTELAPGGTLRQKKKAAANRKNILMKFGVWERCETELKCFDGRLDEALGQMAESSEKSFGVLDDDDLDGKKVAISSVVAERERMGENYVHADKEKTPALLRFQGKSLRGLARNKAHRRARSETVNGDITDEADVITEDLPKFVAAMKGEAAAEAAGAKDMQDKAANATSDAATKLAAAETSNAKASADEAEMALDRKNYDAELAALKKLRNDVATEMAGYETQLQTYMAQQQEVNDQMQQKEAESKKLQADFAKLAADLLAADPKSEGSAELQKQVDANALKVERAKKNCEAVMEQAAAFRKDREAKIGAQHALIGDLNGILSALQKDGCLQAGCYDSLGADKALLGKQWGLTDPEPIR